MAALERIPASGRCRGSRPEPADPSLAPAAVAVGGVDHVRLHPTLRFVSTRIERTGDVAKIHGNLTIRGVTKPVVLEGELMGIAPAAGGKRRVGFEASATVNRMDYGVSWNRGAEGGGVVLGDEVQITMVIAAIEK